MAGTISSTASQITFTRALPGDAVPSAADSEFIPDVGPTYRGGAAIMKPGHNNIGPDPASVVIDQTAQAFDWFSTLYKRVLVIGLYATTNQAPGSAAYQKVEVINAAFSERYGILYWDIRAYLSSPQIWTDTGFTPTSADLEAQALGQMAPTLARAVGDVNHLNDTASMAVAHQIAQKLISLEWYGEAAQ
ncbi:MAG: hypothetical protein Q4615_10465 [Paracoccus aminovorans]|nr:hypothetical protein [Paracoccus aminovorans]MDQ7776272.1 hypothetical protein [Paracoccus aminovorans]